MDTNRLARVASDLARITSDLGVENAKLRELAWILAHCAAGHGCDICPVNGGCGHVGEQDMCDTVHERIRELEIEVG